MLRTFEAVILTWAVAAALLTLFLALPGLRRNARTRRRP